MMGTRPDIGAVVVPAHQIGGRGQPLQVLRLQRGLAVRGRQLGVGVPPRLPREGTSTLVEGVSASHTRDLTAPDHAHGDLVAGDDQPGPAGDRATTTPAIPSPNPPPADHSAALPYRRYQVTFARPVGARLAAADSSNPRHPGQSRDESDRGREPDDPSSTECHAGAGARLRIPVEDRRPLYRLGSADLLDHLAGAAAGLAGGAGELAGAAAGRADVLAGAWGAWRGLVARGHLAGWVTAHLLAALSGLRAHAARSKIAAMPWPPPMHMVTRARRPPVRLSS